MSSTVRTSTWPRLKRIGALALALLITVTSFAAADPDDADADDSGDKNLVMTKVVRVEESGVLVVAVGKDATERKLQITKDSHVSYIGFKGINQPADQPKAGFGLKANVDGDVIKAVLFSPPYPELKETPDKHKLSDVQLFTIADENKNGKVDFVEYATWIFQSAKHLPDRYADKFDLDDDDVLDQREFTASLNRLDWWRMTRRTPEQWVAFADKNKNGGLEKDEATGVISSGHGSFDQLFDKLDRDKSGGLSAEELAPHIAAAIGKKNKTAKTAMPRGAISPSKTESGEPR